MSKELSIDIDARELRGEVILSPYKDTQFVEVRFPGRKEDDPTRFEYLQLDCSPYKIRIHSREYKTQFAWCDNILPTLAHFFKIASTSALFPSLCNGELFVWPNIILGQHNTDPEENDEEPVKYNGWWFLKFEGLDKILFYKDFQEYFAQHHIYVDLNYDSPQTEIFIEEVTELNLISAFNKFMYLRTFEYECQRRMGETRQQYFDSIKPLHLENL